MSKPVKLQPNRKITIGDTGNFKEILRKAGYYSGHQRWPRIKSYYKIATGVAIVAEKFGGNQRLAKEEIRRLRHENMLKSGWAVQPLITVSK
jgi:hypothetical protein